MTPRRRIYTIVLILLTATMLGCGNLSPESRTLEAGRNFLEQR